MPSWRGIGIGCESFKKQPELSENRRSEFVPRQPQNQARNGKRLSTRPCSWLLSVGLLFFPTDTPTPYVLGITMLQDWHQSRTVLTKARAAG